MKLKKIFFAVLAGLLISCGDSTRNDNGVSFTFFGWFVDATGATGIAGIDAVLTGAGIGSDAGVAGDLLGFAGMQNNLSGQFVIVESVHHDYYVPGLNLRIPSTVTGLSAFARPPAQPAAGAAPVATTSTLPPNLSSNAGAVYGRAQLIPGPVNEYISLNRDRLPETPFSLIITSYVQGVTSSGRRIKSNELQLEIIVQSDLVLGNGTVNAAGIDETELDAEVTIE